MWKKSILMQIVLSFIYRVKCRLGLHGWEITKYSSFKGNKLQSEGFNRECQSCGKCQQLKRPKEYHPSKYIWTDLTTNQTLK